MQSSLMSIVDAYRQNNPAYGFAVNVPEGSKIRTMFEAFKRCVLHAMEEFLLKDLIALTDTRATPDMLRGLLFNRIRTRISYTQYNYRFRARFVECMHIDFSKERTDVKAIRLYDRHSTSLISETNRYSSEAERYLSIIFEDMGKLGSMFDYVKKNGLYTTNSLRDKPVTENSYYTVLKTFLNHE